MYKSLGTIAFLFTSLASLGVSQTATPTPQPKVNARPSPTPAAEPYDGKKAADMIGKCVSLDTESGVIDIELFPESAPETVRNFLNLVATGLYDTTTFSRVVPGFVIQGGNIWTRTTAVSKPIGSRARRPLNDEPNPIRHERGILSMAKTDEPNSATTDFFILLESASYLDGKFAAFGRVTKGMDIVEAINKMPVTEEKPEKPVRLNTAKIVACTP
ncbi:MAG TPA: peptidylprolyl isomerase [Pyrinomonadaceae bacterium]|nr:peptidylprolyl isomerase [Pyrinomonadaceae bacterium]